MSKKGKKDTRPTKIYPDPVMGPIRGAYASQPISKADSRFEATGVARPNDASVEESREWIQENKL